MTDGASRTHPRRATVIGLGNPLMGDDGVGLLAIERLQADYNMPSGVEVIDGGTWGMRLLPAIEDAESLLLIDAIDVGMPPGTEVTLPREEIPRTFALKLSPHQIDLAEVLAICEVRGRLPERTVAIGLQPELVQWGSPISASVERRIDALVATAVYQLSLWGHSCTPRDVPRA